MKMSLQARIITAFALLGIIALATGSVLLLGFAMAAIAVGTIVALMLNPIVRRVRTAWDLRPRGIGLPAERRTDREDSPIRKAA